MMTNINQFQLSKKWRERNKVGDMIETDVLKDVFVVFKVFVPAGHSTFDVPIPRGYMNRLFSFNDLFLIPILYSDQAAAYDLETEAELDEEFIYTLSLRMNFDDRNSFYPDTFIGTAVVKTTPRLIRDINSFFEIKKMASLLHLGCFFDWVDIRFDDRGDETFDQYMQKMAPVFYGEPYDPVKHFNALPPSARNIYEVNNYLFPSVRSPDTLENVRFRINIAPNTNAIFSTDGHLKNFGFNEGQIGERTGRNQFVMANANKNNYLVITCFNKPTMKLSVDAVTFKMSLAINTHNYYSEPSYVTITKRDYEKNVNFEKAVKNTLEELAHECNIKFGISYDANAKKFTFVFPHDPFNTLKESYIILSPELSERLGYNQRTDISEENKTGSRVDDTPDPKETEDKARALAYDTSVVIISDNSKASMNSLSGIGETYMASLYPTETGTMEMKINQFCKEQPFMEIPNETNTPPLIPVTFLMSTFLDENIMVKFDWKVGAFINGTLRGVHPLKTIQDIKMSF